MKYDFSGYATKNNIKCSDGRVIIKDAFISNDGKTVPLVWQHLHDDPTNVLGHALLQNRNDGVYAFCSFNSTDSANHAKELIKHGDINSMSIYANQLKQNGSNVIHGEIREVSLVLSGANPGAYIDNLNFQHSDGSINTDDSEAVIYSGEELSLMHADNKETSIEKEGDKPMGKKDKPMEKEKTIQEIFNELTEEQKEVVYAMLAAVMENEMEQSEYGGENFMKKNVFENKEVNNEVNNEVLSHSDIKAIFEEAQKVGSLKEAFLAHAGTYGIDNIDFLFPDAKTVTPAPTFIKRDTNWVQTVMNETRHTPFSRIKSTAADITAAEARALGYITGNLKKEEVIRLLKRVTNPTTIYKKQKLDRDDIVDITDFDTVSWLKMEMRMMLDEELARSFLIGDGREIESLDKISEENIRPIYKDDNLYAHHVTLTSDKTTEDIIESIIRSRKEYKGTGTPSFFTTTDVLTNMLLLKDTLGRRLYNNVNELTSALRVDKIVEVPVMEGVSRISGVDTLNLIGIVVNLKDYNVGADKGGEVNMFDDFDIDYNQYKYLMETRCSGALVQPKSALVFEQIAVAG